MENQLGKEALCVKGSLKIFFGDQHHNEGYSLNYLGIVFCKTVLHIAFVARFEN